MATFIKRDSGRWQARVRRLGGKMTSRTFSSKSAAETWARSQESAIEAGTWRDRSLADRTTLASLLQRYESEVVAGRKSFPVERYRLRRIVEDLGHHRLSALSPVVLAEWRDERLKAVAPATVNRELSTLGGALSWARKELMVPLPENPVAAIRRPKGDRARDRRLEPGELEALLKALESAPAERAGEKRRGKYQVGTRNAWIKPLVLLAVETAMRQGELLSLLWRNVDLPAQTAHLVDTKNGEARTVPLSTRAVAILTVLPRDESERRVFPITAEAAKRAWLRACARASVADLHFHDLRHEATSRLAEKLPNVIELAAVTGHKDLRMLKRYYHPRASDLAKKLG